jgi:hypothetical protein
MLQQVNNAEAPTAYKPRLLCCDSTAVFIPTRAAEQQRIRQSLVLDICRSRMLINAFSQRLATRNTPAVAVLTRAPAVSRVPRFRFAIQATAKTFDFECNTHACCLRHDSSALLPRLAAESLHERAGTVALLITLELLSFNIQATLPS